MNPLSTFKYTKNNFSKSLPILISMVVGVLLIYIFSLVTKSSLEIIDLTYFNFFSKYTAVCSNNEQEIPKDLLEKISKDNNVDNVIPLINENGIVQYTGIFGEMSISVLNLYKNDISKFVDTLNIKLVEGKLPSENEIMLPKKYVLEAKLKLGDYIGSEVSSSYTIKGKFKICGITDGPVMTAVISDNKASIARDTVMKHSILFSVKDLKNKTLIDYLSKNAPKNIIITDYYSAKKTLTDMIDSINSLSFILATIIIFVMCISLGNLNYISFINRKYEFGVLSTIGYKKSSLYFKLWKETAFVCLIGYILGIILTTLAAFIINLIVLEPRGQFIPLWSTSGVFISFLIPTFVSILSLIAPIKELRKTDALEAINGAI